MTDRSGCGLVELTVLQSLEVLTAGRPRAHVKSARAVAGIEERIGLGPQYGYQVLLDLARPWTVAVRLVSGRGNLGGRGFDPPAADRYTDSRQSRVGQLVLDTEAHRFAPVPVGLPAQVGTSDAVQAITSRLQPRHWRGSHPELARRIALPVAHIYDESRHDVRIHLSLEPGSDPAAVRDQLLDVDGIGWNATRAFPAPLASMLRSWVEQHQGEDIAASLTRPEDAIRRDQANG